ncbi:MAG: hypothetical protein ACI8ZM_005479 [Crocinitomix sp.]|jgi:hypothetical protein
MMGKTASKILSNRNPPKAKLHLKMLNFTQTLIEYENKI